MQNIRRKSGVPSFFTSTVRQSERRQALGIAPSLLRVRLLRAEQFIAEAAQLPDSL